VNDNQIVGFYNDSVSTTQEIKWNHVDYFAFLLMFLDGYYPGLG